MTPDQQKKLEAAGWAVGGAEEFLGAWRVLAYGRPGPDTWYVGLEVRHERDFETGILSTIYSLQKGYPGTEPATGVTHWYPLPDPRYAP